MKSIPKNVACQSLTALSLALLIVASIVILYSIFEYHKVDATVLTSERIVYRDFDETETFNYISFKIEAEGRNITIYDQVSGSYYPVNKTISVCVASFNGHYVDSRVTCYFEWLVIPTFTLCFFSLILVIGALAMLREHCQKQTSANQQQKEITQLTELMTQE